MENETGDNWHQNKVDQMFECMHNLHRCFCSMVQQTVGSVVTDYLNDIQPGLNKLELARSGRTRFGARSSPCRMIAHSTQSKNPTQGLCGAKSVVTPVGLEPTTL